MKCLIVLAGLIVSACGGNSTTPPATPTVTFTGLTIGGGGATFTDRNQISQFTAVANFSNGTAQDQTLAAAWSSSNPSVATVTSSGLVTSITSGTSLISATFQGMQGSRTATVTIACQINNTASVTFGNRSAASATQNVVWDGSNIFTLTAGQNSTAITAVAGIPHTLLFRVASSGATACTQGTPILVQCSTQTFTCSFP